MKFKPIQSVLLLTLLLWASGFAEFAHDRTEHAQVAPVEVIKLPAGCQRVPVKSQAPLSHDDCAICFMLNMMKAERSAPPTIVPMLQRTPEIVVIEHLSADTHPVQSFLPIRGPPVA